MFVFHCPNQGLRERERERENYKFLSEWMVENERPNWYRKCSFFRVHQYSLSLVPQTYSASFLMVVLTKLQ